MANGNDDLAATSAKAIADMTPDEARAEIARREVQKLSRRAALAKMGVRSAMTIFAAFSIDDLARMVGKKMEQNAAQNAAVNEVARQLQNAGLSFAYKKAVCVTWVDDKDNQVCVGDGCLTGMPGCGCSCKAGALCQECCDSKCPAHDSADPSLSSRAACYLACDGG